jgi:hypothetical protein
MGIVTDTERCGILAAETAAQRLRAFVDHAPISAIARDVLRQNLDVVEHGLGTRRIQVGLSERPLSPFPPTPSIDLERRHGYAAGTARSLPYEAR